MTLNVRTGGTWKNVNQPWVKQGGTWKACTGVFVKIGGVWKQTWAAGVAIYSALTAGTNDQQLPVGSSGVTQILFNESGAIQGNGDYTGSPQWLSSVLSGNGAGYWIRVTLTSGTLSGTSDATGVWLQMNVSRSFSKSTGTNGSGLAHFNVEFARDGGGVTIVSTTNGWYLTYSHN